MTAAIGGGGAELLAPPAGPPLAVDQRCVDSSPLVKALISNEFDHSSEIERRIELGMPFGETDV